jgi:hypothetical protein
LIGDHLGEPRPVLRFAPTAIPDQQVEGLLVDQSIHDVGGASGVDAVVNMARVGEDPNQLLLVESSPSAGLVEQCSDVRVGGRPPDYVVQR